MRAYFIVICNCNCGFPRIKNFLKKVGFPPCFFRVLEYKQVEGCDVPMQIPTKSVPNPILDRVHEGRHRGRYGTAIASHSIFDILTYPNGVGFTLSINET